MRVISRFALWELTAFLRRRRRIITVVSAAGTALAILVALRLPSVYQATSVIVVENRDTEQAYPGGLLTPRLEQRLRLAQAFLKSDALIRRAVTRLHLAPDPGDEAAVMDTVAAIRDKLDIKVTGVDFVEVTLEGRDPAQISDIVNTLTAEFLQENESYSKRVVSDASTVLADEVKQSEARLRDFEARIKSFRERHRDELPDQLTLHLQNVASLEQRVVTLTRELREAKDRAAALEQEVAATPKTLVSDQVTEGDRAALPLDTRAPLAARLDTLQGSLDAARAKYTEDHPEVIRLRRAVADATARLAAEPAPGTPDAPPRNVVRQDSPNPAYASLVTSLEISRSAAVGLAAERREAIAELASERARVAQVPRREQELATLTRDYEAQKERHHAMMAKMFQADLSRKVTTEQGDDRFKVLDPAVPPLTPVRPRRWLIAVAGIFLAAASAVGVASAVDRVVDTSFHNARDAEQILGLPVVAVIPLIPEPGRRSRA